MKIYVDFKNHIQTEKDKFPFDMGQNLENKVEVYVVNNITDTYYPQMQFITPDGRKPILYNPDALQTGQTCLVTVDGTQYKYYAFTLTDEITKKPGRLQISCYINFTTLGTNNVVLVTKRALLFDCMNEIKKATGYTSNTMLFVDTGTDGEQVVTDFRTFINSYAALISQKVNTADLLAGTLSPKFNKLTVLDNTNGVALNCISAITYDDETSVAYVGSKVVSVSEDNSGSKWNFLCDYLTWNGYTLATESHVNDAIDEMLASNNSFTGVNKFTNKIVFNNNDMKIYSLDEGEGYIEFLEGLVICNGTTSSSYYMIFNDGIEFRKPTTFATAPTISQLQQSDNSAVTRKFVNDSITEAMKEHIIDYWFEVSNGQLVLKQKLQNQTIMTRQVTLPSVLQNATFNDTTMKLTLDFVNGQDIEVDLSELNDVYGVENNGHNVVLSLNNGKFSADLTQVVLDKLEQAFTNEETRISNETTREAYFNSIKNTLNSVSGTLCVVDVDANGNMNLTTVDFE